jgi:hypothetical protein
MKTFKDLEFKPHSISGIQATMNFDNKYGVSVVCGSMFYSNGIDTYELGVLYEGSLTYNTYITDDVLGGLSSNEVTNIMVKVQNL